MSSTIDERDRLTFYADWYQTVKLYPDELRLAWYDAVMRFAFDGEEPQGDGGDLKDAIAAGAVAQVRRGIEISRKRRLLGSKGGAKRKQTQSKAQANEKQNESKTKAKRNQEEEQEQEQEQELKAKSATARRPPTLKQFLSIATRTGVPETFAEEKWYELLGFDWKDAKGRNVANASRYLKSAWIAEQKKIRAARGEEASPLEATAETIGNMVFN